MRSAYPISLLAALAGLAISLAMAALARGQGAAAPAPGAAAPAGAVKAAADDIDAFAVDLYGRVAAGEGNVFFSPYSIDSALAMTYAGARGNTATQMAKAMHFSLAADQLHPALATLSATLNGGGKAGDKILYEMVVANALWGQKGYAYQKPFLDLLANDYGAGLNEVDFKGATEAARGQINGWVEKQTHDRIKDLIAAGALAADTRLVLTNAIYFKGNWTAQFKKDQTADQPFTTAGGKAVQAPLMHQRHEFRYMEDEQLQAIELPYAGDTLSMVVLLPRKADGLGALEKSLGVDALKKWIDGLRPREADLFLPRFKMTCQFELAKPLIAMGMTDAFCDKADFSGIATHEQLLIDKVVHKAFVDVNEEGTEAAGATAVTMSPAMTRVNEPPPVTFRADHPFLFLIRHRSTGAVLFLGRLAEPGK